MVLGTKKYCQRFQTIKVTREIAKKITYKRNISSYLIYFDKYSGVNKIAHSEQIVKIL